MFFRNRLFRTLAAVSLLVLATAASFAQTPQRRVGDLNSPTAGVPQRIVYDASGRFARETPTEIRAEWFGAAGDSVSDDTAALRAAIAYAGPLRRPVLLTPGARYRVTGKLWLQNDGAAIFGQGASILVDVDSIAIIAQRTTVDASQPVESIRIDGLTVRSINGKGPNSSGFIQLNRCLDCTVSNVFIEGDAAALTSRGRLANGISTSNGSGVVFSAVTVDGVSKPGIYFANGTEYARCIGCVVRNVSGPLGDQPGFYISGNTNIELVGCESYSNQGHGVQVSTDGFPSPDGTGTRHVRIVGGAFHNNGANGLNVGHLSNKRVEDLLVTGGSYYANGNHGINIASGERVVIDAVQAYENDVAGVMLDNNSGALTRSTVQNSHIYNNNVTSSYGGIVMRGTHYARAVDNWLYNDQDTKTQDYGFLFIVGTGDVANRHLYIEGNQIGDHALATFGGQTSATIDETTGYISAWRAGSPQNINWHFPLRSLVLDTTTGREWVKEVTGTAGWRRRTAQSMGTQTVNMAETAIAHGLGYAPGMVTVTPFANQTVWQTRAADATNVYLSASADGTTVRIQVK